MTGGELYDKIRCRATYTERDVAEVVRQIMSAVRYMHQNHVCHRDLKPENLLCEGAVDEFRIKVADFGISRMYKVGEDMSTVCGSPEYVGLSLSLFLFWCTPSHPLPDTLCVSFHPPYLEQHSTRDVAAKAVH